MATCMVGWLNSILSEQCNGNDIISLISGDCRVHQRGLAVQSNFGLIGPG